MSIPNISDIKEAFERWHADKFGWLNNETWPESGEYCDTLLQSRWESWQACAAHAANAQSAQVADKLDAERYRWLRGCAGLEWGEDVIDDNMAAQATDTSGLHG